MIKTYLFYLVASGREPGSRDIVGNRLITMICGVECYFYCLDKRSIRTCRSRPTSCFPGYTPRL
jgi:hypothetical protein